MGVLQQLAAGAALREDPDVLTRRLFLTVAEPVGLDFFVHYRYPGQGEVLKLAATSGLSEEQAAALGTLVLGEAVCGTVAQTRTPMAYADVDASGDERLALAASLGARTYASFPLLDGAELLGTLSFGSRTRQALAPAELEVLRAATDVLAAAEAHHHDHLALGRAREQATEQTVRVQQLSERVAWLDEQARHLTDALAGRDRIAQAKGMLMMRFSMPEDDAWRLLIQSSQHTNRRVRDIASVLVNHFIHGEPFPDDLRRQFPADL